ncbi:MAG: hypothetical protein HZC40_09135 [Chloroflexi bacterium]|nr:hypothetical protein [Chloroflexota bacterium]
MKSKILFVLVVMTLVACAPTAAPTSAPTQSNVQPSVAPAPTQAAASNAASCTTTNAAPPDQFRSDDPKKLEASAKPKLVEFFAFW